MADIDVVEGAPGTFRVTVTDRGRTTSHTVTVPVSLPAALGCPEMPLSDLVRRSFDFLLEREPSTSILSSFSLEQIENYFPDYPAVIGRLGSGPTVGREPGP